MKTVTFVEVQTHGEDGRGPKTVHARFASEEAAKCAFPESPWHSYETVVLCIYDHAKDWEDNNPEKLRENALAKLTAAERQLLGLK